MLRLGENIKYFRMKLGYTQKDLSEILNVTPQAVSRWELDRVEPSIDSLNIMAHLFHISVDELINDDHLTKIA